MSATTDAASAAPPSSTPPAAAIGRPAWICTGCARRWSAHQVRERQSVGTAAVLVQCPACRERCRPAADPRRIHAPSRLEAFADGFSRPFDGTGLAILFVLGAIQWVPIVGPFLYFLGGYPYFQTVLRHAARGRSGMPQADDFTDLFDDAVLPSLRILFASWVVLLPAMIYLGWAPVRDPGDPMLIALLLLGVAYLPGVLVVVALSGSLFRAMNPIVAIKLVGVLGADYALMLVAGAGFVVLTAVVVPFVAGPLASWVAPWTSAYAATVTMAIFGNLARRHARALGIEA